MTNSFDQSWMTNDTVRNVTVQGISLEMMTRAGYPEWETVSPTVDLLAEAAEIKAHQCVLVCPCGNGVLGAWAGAAQATAQVTQMDTNAIAVELAAQTVRYNDLPAIDVRATLPLHRDGPYDVILMPKPKGRAQTRLLLAHAFEALASDGRLYLAGANNAGIKSSLSDAEELFGSAQLLGYRRGHRVALVTKTRDPDDWPAAFLQPGIRPGTYAQIEAIIDGYPWTFLTRPGVFSWEHLDPGTALLLQHVTIEPNERVLDIGCGYGAIGLVAASRAPRVDVTMVDVDALAVDCARANTERLQMPHVRVLLGDGVGVANDQRYSLVLSNPPFHAGETVSDAATLGFIRDAYHVLEPGGCLVLVANRFLPYQREMENLYTVRMLAQTPGYHVIRGRKR